VILGGREIPTLQALGDAVAFVDRNQESVAHAPMFSSFSREETSALASAMQAYQVEPLTAFIFEGDAGDFMVFLLEGEVEVFKGYATMKEKLIAAVGPGKTLGEMSLIDGEPRFATCVSVGRVIFFVLSRAGLERLLSEQPALAAKILMQLAALLNQRLRNISDKLLEYLK
jgi:CRP/FNR family transcriptional regulator, cyclic AMP receptor protein